MKQVNKLITTRPLISQTQAGEKEVRQEEKQIVNVVYARLKTIFGNKYTIAFPTEKAVTLSKREWARDIAAFTVEELEQGFRALKSSNIEWPDIKSFLGLCKPIRKEPIHQEYQLPAPSKLNRDKGRKLSAGLLDLMKK